MTFCKNVETLYVGLQRERVQNILLELYVEYNVLDMYENAVPQSPVYIQEELFSGYSARRSKRTQWSRTLIAYFAF
jgi:hypothetical protein